MITRTLTLAFALTFSLSTAYSQIYCSVFGGSGAEFGYDALATADGGYIVVGSTDSYGAGGIDCYIVKFDATGNSQWTKTVGDFGSDIAYGISVAENGDYLIGGETNSLGTGGGDAYVIRLDASGNLLWTRSIGGIGYDYGKEITATTDNGCAIIGTTNSFGAGDDDAYVAKLDSNGVVEWTKAIGSVNTEGGYGIIASSDGNIVIAGRCFPGGSGGAQAFVTKFDYAGATIWSKYFTSHDVNDFFVPSDFVETNGGYVISGFCDTVSGANKGSFLTKISPSGSHQWTRIIGIAGNDNGYGMEKTADGGFIISGIYFGATANAYVVKTDSSGATQWYAKSTSSGNSYSYSVIQLNDGYFISLGNTDAVDGSDLFLMRVDSVGGLCCGAYSNSSSGYLACTWGNYGIIGSGGIVDTGGVENAGGTLNVICSSPLGVETTGPEEIIHLYPNPTDGQITINGLGGFDHIAIVNALGEIIYESDINTDEIKLYLLNNPAGVYFANLRSKERRITKKLLIE